MVNSYLLHYSSNLTCHHSSVYLYSFSSKWILDKQVGISSIISIRIIFPISMFEYHRKLPIQTYSFISTRFSCVILQESNSDRTTFHRSSLYMFTTNPIVWYPPLSSNLRYWRRRHDWNNRLFSLGITIETNRKMSRWKFVYQLYWKCSMEWNISKI